MSRRKAFAEVAGWKIDAKLEDTDRYFYKTLNVDMLLNGSKSYVIGRKGTGKTAIARFLKSQVSYNFFAVNISLKSFPFNELYSLKDDRYTNPNEYITIWKFIIYMEILTLMSRNQIIDNKFRSAIDSILPKKPNQGLSRKIRKITSDEISLDAKIFSFSRDYSYSEEKMSWVDKVDFIEDLIVENIDRSNYFILFDELDEDYKYQSAIDPEGNYLDLISGLFKAVQHIKSISFDRGLKVNPVIFLRDDIYDLIEDHDKNKWSDLIVNLSWTRFTIQPMIAYRLARALNPHSIDDNFGKIWNQFFSNELVAYGTDRQKTMTIYDWISRESLLRPRDFVKYIQLCAEQIYESNYSHIYPATVTTQDIIYSRYFRGELTDEVHSLLPDISRIFDIFAKIGKAQLSIDEFKEVYECYIKQDKLKHNNNCTFVLEVLFNFSIIGNLKRGNDHEIFRFINPEANLNFELPITIHRGLYKSLQLI